MSQGKVWLNNIAGHDINPATEEGATLILNELLESIAKNSLDFGTESISLGEGGAATTAGDQPCRTVLISHTGTAIYVENSGTGDADASSFYLPPDVAIEIPVRNTNKLSFYTDDSGGTTVFLLWRD